MTNAPRYRRSDKHPVDAGLVFWRYNRGNEIWISVEEYERRKDESIARDRKWKKTEIGIECAKRSWNRANLKHKQRILDYYKLPEVRQRIRDKHNSRPEVIARREARLKWREERAAYRQTKEYKEIIRERNRISHAKRVVSGKNRELCRRRWYENPQHRLASNMRRLVRQALFRTKVVKSQHLLNLLGCSMPEFKAHLESQFELGMSWKNMGAWEIDHRVPLSSFNLADPEQQKLAFNFHNCRPLWKQANRKKSDKMDSGERGRDIRKIIPFKAA